MTKQLLCGGAAYDSNQLVGFWPKQDWARRLTAGKDTTVMNEAVQERCVGLSPTMSVAD